MAIGVVKMVNSGFYGMLTVNCVAYLGQIVAVEQGYMLVIR